MDVPTGYTCGYTAASRQIQLQVPQEKWRQSRSATLATLIPPHGHAGVDTKLKTRGPSPCEWQKVRDDRMSFGRLSRPGKCLPPSTGQSDSNPRHSAWEALRPRSEKYADRKRRPSGPLQGTPSVVVWALQGDGDETQLSGRHGTVWAVAHSRHAAPDAISALRAWLPSRPASDSMSATVRSNSSIRSAVWLGLAR